MCLKRYAIAYNVAYRFVPFLNDGHVSIDEKYVIDHLLLTHVLDFVCSMLALKKYNFDRLLLKNLLVLIGNTCRSSKRPANLQGPRVVVEYYDYYLFIFMASVAQRFALWVLDEKVPNSRNKLYGY